MHILFTSYEFVTEKTPCGGFGHYLSNIASILAEHDHTVTILLSSYRDKVIQWKHNVEVVTFKYEYNGYCIESGIDALLHIDVARYIDRSRKLKQKIIEINKRHKIDIIQYNGDYLEGWCRLRNIPSVIRLSSIDLWYKRAEQIDSDMEDYSWLNEKQMKIFMIPLYRADAVYAPSNCLAEIIKKKYKINIKVIESPFNGIEKYEYCDDIFNLFDKKYILFPSRICNLKGMQTVIEASREILEYDPDIHFVFAGFVGNCYLAESMRVCAEDKKDRIHFLGEIKNQRILYNIMKHAYVCIFPSRADNLSNSCIECMGLGKIVIGSYGASYEQLIKHKKNGLLIKRDSPDSLIKAIKYVNRMSEKDIINLGENAIKSIQRLSPQNIYGKIIRFYEKVIRTKTKNCIKG